MKASTHILRIGIIIKEEQQYVKCSRKDLTEEFRRKIWLFHISHSTNCLPEYWVAYTTDKKCYDVCYVSLHYRPFWEGMLGHNADGKTYIDEKYIVGRVQKSIG